MREIEIKARVKSTQQILDILAKKGIEVTEPIKQHDVVYGRPGAAENAFDSVWLRIRTENASKCIFTLKRSVVGHLDSIEHETAIDDPIELANIIKEMGFELYSDLTKIRKKAKVDDIELCIDKVPCLGSFVEAEKLMPDDSDHKKVTNELWEFLEQYGVTKKDKVDQGYDVLERKQRGL